MDETRRRRWESAANWPLMVMAMVFLVAYAWPILDPGLSPAWVRVTEVAMGLSWAAFAIDYVVRLVLSRARGRFVRHNVVDLLVVAVPLLRPLRLLQLVRVLEVLHRSAAASLRGRVAVYVVGGTTLVLFVASLAALDVERDAPGSTITSFGDALWWAFATVTTVGYGDRYPVTGTGRMVAVGLMVCGIALLGVVTAWLASWLIDRVADVEEERQAATRRDVTALTAEVAALREELSRRQGP
ncbi:MAG TPA: ion channel [Nocardioidaceae bacterium]